MPHANGCHNSAQCDKVSIKYRTQSNISTYGFTFEYTLDSEVEVGLWDEEKLQYVAIAQDDENYPWEFPADNPTQIKFTDDCTSS